MNDRITWVLVGIALLLAGASWGQGGTEQVIGGLVEGGKLLISVLPLLISAFLVAGLVQALVSDELINRWLGSASGWRGIAIACIGGALIPGGPYVYYPLAASLMKAGAGLGVLVAFVTAKNAWSITRIPLEIALLGPQLALIRFGMTLIIPPLLGYLAETLFGGRMARIREMAGS